MALRRYLLAIALLTSLPLLYIYISRNTACRGLSDCVENISETLIISVDETFDANHTASPSSSTIISPLDTPYVLPDAPVNATDVKYLTYFPHSGFHNQRIALGNALLLAYLTNRILIMPPILMGHPSWAYQPFEKTQNIHKDNLKAVKSRCEKYSGIRPGDRRLSRAPTECKILLNLSYLPWDEIFDFSLLRRKIPYVNREGLDIKWLEKGMGIKPSETKFLINETQMYTYLYWENPDPSSFPNMQSGMYKQLVLIDDLRKDPARLIHVNSLFGSSRVRLYIPEHKELKHWIGRQFIFSQPDLVRAADSIVMRLGGPFTYLALHARVGDGPFLRNSEKVIQGLYEKFSLKNPPPPNVTVLSPAECLSPSYSKDFPLIYIATDNRKYPRRDPLFSIFFKSYPCVLTLSDVFSISNSSLGKVINPHDKKNIGNLMIPFLDGLVTVRSKDFTGTTWSTFSKWLRGMNDWAKNELTATIGLSA